MTVVTLLKEKYFIGVTFNVRSLVHYNHSEKHGGSPADMGLRKELRVPHLDPQATGSKHRDTLAKLLLMRPQSPPPQ